MRLIASIGLVVGLAGAGCGGVETDVGVGVEAITGRASDTSSNSGVVVVVVATEEAPPNPKAGSYDPMPVKPRDPQTTATNCYPGKPCPGEK